MSWLTYALMTVFFWGVYGVILHKGRGLLPMGPETPHASLKAFLMVCVAYAVIGVVAAVLLKSRGSNWSFSPEGLSVSLLAGIAGAAGAFTLVLALGEANKQFGVMAASYVMPIVFAGAPIVNAIVAMLMHPPEGGFKSIPVLFYVGIVLAATGGYLVASSSPSNTGGGKKAGSPAEAKH